MKKRFYTITLVIIFCLGLFLRLYQLGNIPNSLNWDEVSWGYNAYSIAETGKDEYGEDFPLSFKAFDDYKQPTYIYLDAIIVRFLGLSPLTTRLPSAILGSLTVIFVYLLTYELFRKKQNGEYIALLAMLFFAISPWSIQFSRIAYEANVGIFFLISGVWLFLYGINRSRSSLIFIGTFVLSISCYTYHSQKLFTPLFFIVLLIFTYTYFVKRKLLFVSLLTFFLICNSVWILDARTTQRGRSVLFLSQQTHLLESSLEKTNYDKARGDIFGALSHNRRIIYTKIFLSHYLLHFDPNFLFIKGDDVRHHAPLMGVLYLSTLPFILMGIYYLCNSYREYWLLFAWFLLAPVASSLAVDAPNASRSLVFLPTWDIFTAVGIVQVFRLTSNGRVRYGLLTLCGIVFLVNILYFVHNYFVHTNFLTEKYWQAGYKESISYVRQFHNTDRRIVFGQDIEQAYIFYLYYTTYDPHRYIQNGGSRRKNKECFSIDNAYFGSCDDTLQKGDIYITSKHDSVSDSKVLHNIYYQNSQKAISIYEKM